MCDENHITTCVITFWFMRVISLTMTRSAMHFHIEIMFILNAIESHFKVLYDKQNLTNHKFHTK